MKKFPTHYVVLKWLTRFSNVSSLLYFFSTYLQPQCTVNWELNLLHSTIVDRLGEHIARFGAVHKLRCQVFVIFWPPKGQTKMKVLLANLFCLPWKANKPNSFVFWANLLSVLSDLYPRKCQRKTPFKTQCPPPPVLST